jgi:oligoendopeptidase F
MGHLTDCLCLAALTRLSYAKDSMSFSYPDHWCLKAWFSDFGAADYIAFKEALSDDLQALGEKTLAGEASPTEIAQHIVALEALGDRLGHLSAYLGCLSAEDANHEGVKSDEAWCATLEAENLKLHANLRSLLAHLKESSFQQLMAEPSMKDAGHAIQRMRLEGSQQMKAELESLAADLNVNGLHAWGRLYDTLTGQMEFSMTFPDGHMEQVPMSRRRALMAMPDRRLRAAAFHEGQKPWLDHEVTLAAALNGIAGTRLSLYERRGLGHFLDTPLFDAVMSREALEAMLTAIRENLELPRRALRKAAALQGTSALCFYDLEAPQVTAPTGMNLSWNDACTKVEAAFQAAYPALGEYFREMLAKRWIEAKPRTGKRPGAFCTGSLLRREQRVYMTYHGTVHDMVTLAHEVGHAWHSHVLNSMRSMAVAYPMTLAETASNFGEMILLSGMMQDSSLDAETRAYLIDQEMLRAHANLVNIPMRYEFEKAFYTERAAGEVSVSRIKELMKEAQHQLYGDALAAGGEDSMFWASKMHFFITGLSFYNYPYVFGYLLSQALFAQFKEEGQAFLPRYEDFLRLTGSASCEEVVRQTLGQDLADPAFWSRAVQAMTPSLEAYEAL